MCVSFFRMFVNKPEIFCDISFAIFRFRCFFCDISFCDISALFLSAFTTREIRFSHKKPSIRSSFSFNSHPIPIASPHRKLFPRELSISTILRTSCDFVFFHSIHSLFFYGTISGYVVACLFLSSFPIIRQYSFSEKEKFSYTHMVGSWWDDEWMVRPRRSETARERKGKKTDTKISDLFFSFNFRKRLRSNNKNINNNRNFYEWNFFLLQTSLCHSWKYDAWLEMKWDEDSKRL